VSWFTAKSKTVKFRLKDKDQDLDISLKLALGTCESVDQFICFRPHRSVSIYKKKKREREEEKETYIPK